MCARPSESGRTRPSARIRPNPPVRPNPAELRFGDGRPNPAGLRFGTAARIRPTSDLGRPSESGRNQIGDDRPNPAEKNIKQTNTKLGRQSKKSQLYRRRPQTYVRPNPAEPARASESGRTRIWGGRPNPAELRFGTTARIRPSSDWGRPPESSRKTHSLILNCSRSYWKFIRLYCEKMS